VLLLTPVFAIAAADREWQGLQPPFGDSVAALEAGSILAGIDADERRVDARQRVRPHLDQRQVHVTPRAGVGVIEVVAGPSRRIDPAVAQASVHVVVYLATARAQ